MIEESFQVFFLTQDRKEQGGIVALFPAYLGVSEVYAGDVADIHDMLLLYLNIPFFSLRSRRVRKKSCFISMVEHLKDV